MFSGEARAGPRIARTRRGDSMQIHTILWRRVDNPGHDACRLLALGDAWRLEGTAVFRQEGVPACLTYKVDCDANWRTREGAVHG